MADCSHRDDPYACLKHVPIFARLSEEEHAEIADITTAKTVKKGEFIYLIGDRGGVLYVLHKGHVKVSRLGANGKEQVVRIIGPGDFLGELSLFTGEKHTDMAEATSDATMCLIEGKRLNDLMRRYGTIAVKVMHALSQRLSDAERLIESINLVPAKERLAGALLDLGGDKDRFTLPLSKRDLASLIGMTQETLSRSLAALQADKLIDLSGKRSIVILDRPSMYQLVGR